MLRNCFVLVALLWAASAEAVIYLQVKTSVGNMTLELYDQEKPITVNNFMQYVRSGKWTNQFIQRWEVGFVIQGGGWTVNTNAGVPVQVASYGNILNEFTPDPKFSNKYATIAMARQPGNTNSASTQWFINLQDNPHLDGVDGGFTVFGKVISGLEVLNLFKAAKGTQTPPLYTASYNAAQTGLNTIAVTKNGNVTFNDVVYIDFIESPRPNIKVALARTSRQISFPSVGGVTYTLETSTQLPPVWTTVGTVVGTGGTVTISDPSPYKQQQNYRVRY